MRSEVHIGTMAEATTAVCRSNGRTVTMDRPVDAGGGGAGFNGGEMLLFAIGGCIVNDLHKAAESAGIHLRDVRVTAWADWGGTPVSAERISYDIVVDADADEGVIRDLVTRVERDAAIPGAVRTATPVELGRVTKA